MTMKRYNTDKKDRIRGALYGVAVGDALGAPLEFMTAEEILAKYGTPVREMVGGGWLSVVAGEVRKLADSSRDAASKIFEALESMEKAASHIAERIKSINGLIENQAANMKEISASVAEAKAISDNIEALSKKL